MRVTYNRIKNKIDKNSLFYYYSIYIYNNKNYGSPKNYISCDSC